MDEILQNLPELKKGWIWLAGGGPGDPGLISLLTLKGLRQADVVVYDALINPAILDMARTDAERIFAGKRGGQPSPKQEDISTLLVKLASTGKRILRLKGGDPLVFGRGGEEARMLVKHQIPFRIIPGITAGVGGLAYAGIPATDRHTNSAITFLTGHGADGGLAKDIDWDALAKASPVLVIYMGVARLPQLRTQLLKSGRHENESVAIISRATTNDQKVLETTLGDCIEDLEKVDFPAPAMVVVGENVKLRRGLDWLGAIEGNRILDHDVSDITPQGLRLIMKADDD